MKKQDSQILKPFLEKKKLKDTERLSSLGKLLLRSKTMN